MFKKIGSFFSKLFGSVPSWSQKASTVITLAAPLTNTIVVLAAGEEAAAQVTSAVHEVQSDMAAASAFLSEAHGTATAPAGLTAVLQSVNDNLGALLAAGHIKNPETQTKVEAVVNTITGEISAVIESLPKAA
jgi:pheromone shutdown protein TraB